MKSIMLALLTGVLFGCVGDSSEQSNSELDLLKKVQLDSGTWELMKVYEPEDDWEEVVEGTGYTLTFTESNMSLIGTIDCNSFYTHYDTNETQINIHRVSPTGTACPFLQNSENEFRTAYLKQRKVVLAALKEIQSFELDGTSLVLHSGNDMRLHYRLDGAN